MQESYPRLERQRSTAVLRFRIVIVLESTRATNGRRKALASLASTLLALVLAEGALRLFGGEIYPVPLYPGDVVAVRDRTYDAVIGWKLAPGEPIRETTADYDVTYEVNAQGFRSSHDFAARPPASSVTRRIAFLGDSFTFGSGVREEETFVAGVERRLERTERRRGLATRGEIQAFNYGLGGFGIDQMELALEHYALPWGANLVVVSFIHNDLDRSLSSYRQGHVWLEKPAFHLERGELVRTTAANRPGPLASWFAQDFRLGRLWQKAESSLAKRWPMGGRWRLNRALFVRMRDACFAAGVPLLVVHIPVNRHAAAPLYAREFAELGIDFLDLAPLLPASADGLYFPHDHHFTPAGHRFAGREIARAILLRGLLPVRSGSAPTR